MPGTCAALPLNGATGGCYFSATTWLDASIIARRRPLLAQYERTPRHWTSELLDWTHLRIWSKKFSQQNSQTGSNLGSILTWFNKPLVFAFISNRQVLSSHYIAARNPASLTEHLICHVRSHRRTSAQSRFFALDRDIYSQMVIHRPFPRSEWQVAAQLPRASFGRSTTPKLCIYPYGACGSCDAVKLPPTLDTHDHAKCCSSNQFYSELYSHVIL